MSQFAVDGLASMEGTIKQLGVGISTDMHLRNVQSHVRNALAHVEVTPEIEAGAVKLLRLAQQFGQKRGGLAVGANAKAAKNQHLERMSVAFRELSDLLRKGTPSAEARALGG